MYFFAVESDQLYAWSDENSEPHHGRIAETPRRTLAPTSSAPGHPSRLSHRALQTMRQTGMQVRRRPRSWTQVLFVGQLSRLAAANGLCAPGVLRSDGRVPGQLPSGPRDPRNDLRDQPRTTAPPGGALTACHAPSRLCPPYIDRCESGRPVTGQYAGSLAR